MDKVQQYVLIYTYGLAFLNMFLRPDEGDDAQRQVLIDTAEGYRPFYKDTFIIRSLILSNLDM